MATPLETEKAHRSLIASRIRFRGVRRLAAATALPPATIQRFLSQTGSPRTATLYALAAAAGYEIVLQAPRPKPTPIPADIDG